jgi:GNAT superfamily N-acetyltransferase
METARPALRDDMSACAVLLAKALDTVRSVRGGPALVGQASPEQILARWADAGPSDATIYVGEYDHVIVGLAAATVATRMHADAGERSGRIECCYVEEGARGVGVGSVLMESLVAWCGARGCQDVDALALPGDRHSKQRFEAAGFTARLLVLNRRLS